MSAALHTRQPDPLELLLAHCVIPQPRPPVGERLREKLGAELAGLLVLALARPQRRSARPG